MKKSPCFSLYPDKLLAGTERLSDRAFRAYVKILCWMWLNDLRQFRIKNDSEIFRFATGLNAEACKAAIAEIQHPLNPLLRKQGKFLISNGLRKEAQKQQENRAKKSRAAHARWMQYRCNADASSVQCFPSTFPSTSTSTKKKKDSPLPPSSEEQGVGFLLTNFVAPYLIRPGKTGAGSEAWGRRLRQLLAAEVSSDSIQQWIMGAVFAGRTDVKPWEITDALLKDEKKPKEQRPIYDREIVPWKPDPPMTK